MATVNKSLQALSKEQVEDISREYLLGWHGLEAKYGFRLRGLNRMREKYGLEPIGPEVSMEFRLAKVRNEFSDADIETAIREFVAENRVDAARWSGIELFGCRFNGKEYASAFRALLGKERFGAISEQARRKKLVETQMVEHGGVGLAGAGALDKAQRTNLSRYGAVNVMQCDAVKVGLAATNTIKYGGASPFSSDDVRSKALLHKIDNKHRAADRYLSGDGTASFGSPAEKFVFDTLVDRFGRQDVMYEYGLHPYDARYPYSCDFYVKSQDLFIEVNCHYSHGGHWFDRNSAADVQRYQTLMASGVKRSMNAARCWAETDIEKRETAKRNGIRYLVFWQAVERQRRGVKFLTMPDFEKWANDYAFDYDAFVADNPSNTY